MERLTYFQPFRKGNPGEMPDELYSFCAFPDEETCREWLWMNDYDDEDFDIVEYHDDDIEGVKILDECGYEIAHYNDDGTF